MNRNFFKQPIILGSFGVVILIAAGSLVYYFWSQQQPPYQFAAVTRGPITATVTATGNVTAVENPNLSFEVGGRLAVLEATVGEKVAAGALLAELDNADLQSQLAQAQANAKTAQAKLDGLEAPPRQVDVQVRQTALASAKQALTNTYAGLPDAFQSAFSVADTAVHTDTDSLFSSPNSASPTLAFSTTDTQAGISAVSLRLKVNTELVAWQDELSSLSSDPAALETELSSSVNHLSVVRDYLATVLDVLQSSVANGSFSASTLATDQTTVSAARASVIASMTTLNTLQQSIRTEKIAVQSAQDALDQLLAGATSQDIEAQSAQVASAQAAVSAVEAQLAKTLIRAPFSGTVSAVAFKKGEIVAPNATIVSLVPAAALQVESYVAETDVSNIAVGDAASTTLDAYGDGQVFPATVVSVDQSPTQGQSGLSYKVTLQFNQADPRIRAGMTANVTIATARKNDVLLIPASAVLGQNDSSFALLKTPSGVEQTPITVGIRGDTMAEILSGLSEGQQVVNFGN